MTTERTTAQHPEPVAPASWQRWLVPTTSEAVFAVAFATVLAHGAPGYLTSDTGWHLAAGRRILAGGFPAGDPFTWTHRGEVWHLWEWLWEIAAALVSGMAGLEGVVALSAVLVVLPFAWVHARARGEGANPLVSMPLAALAIGAGSIHAMARPHVVSWLLFVVTGALLERVHAGGRPPWVAISLTTLVWVNTHSGFVYGLTLIVIYMLSTFLEKGPDRSRAPARVYAGLLAVALAASLVNPSGLAALTDVVVHMRADIVHITAEFRSPDFHRTARLFGWLLALALMLVGIGPLRVREGLAAAVFVWAALYSARNIPLAALVLLGPMARIGTELVESGSRGDLAVPSLAAGALSALSRSGRRIAWIESWLTGRIVAPAAVALALGLAWMGPAAWGRVLPPIAFPADLFPVKALEAARAGGLGPGLFNELHWGGYVSYATDGAIPVYIDNRSLLYPRSFLDEYFAILQARGAWEPALARRGVRWLLIPPDCPLAERLAAAPDRYRKVHADAVASVYVVGAGTSGHSTAAQSGL